MKWIVLFNIIQAGIQMQDGSFLLKEKELPAHYIFNDKEAAVKFINDASESPKARGAPGFKVLGLYEAKETKIGLDGK